MYTDDVQSASTAEVKSAFPRLTRGANSGAIFLMKSDSEGYAITEGTDCFMEKGTRVASMDGMIEHDDNALLQKAIAGVL